MKLSEVPTTNLRVVVTLGICIATAAVYLGYALARLWFVAAKAWSPSEVWLLWLATMSGIDAAQFWAKRKTHVP